MSATGEITRLLSSWRDGDEAAAEALLPLVYRELRRLASARLSRERVGHTLQPTELVHEAWLRLVGSDPGTVESRSHFFAAAASAMRRILVEHARRRSAEKRGGGQRPLVLDPERTPAVDGDPDVLDVHRALEDLERVNPRQGRLVELRFFGGLTMPEAAEILGISLATSERDWTAARVWLRRRLRALAAEPSDPQTSDSDRAG